MESCDRNGLRDAVYAQVQDKKPNDSEDNDDAFTVKKNAIEMTDDLAMIVARLYEADFESSSTCQGILYEKVLGCRQDGTGFSCPKMHPDPFLRSIAFWIMKDYTRALDTLLEQTPKEDDENPDVMVKSCNPVVFSFYNYLRTHPLIIRRHFASPDGSERNSSPDQINLIERKLFFTTANAHFKVGCPVLALEVLSKIPKVTKKTSSLSRGASTANVSHAQNGTRASDLDWSQPVMKSDDDELKLDWGDDEEEEEEEEEERGEKDKKGLMMKEEQEEEAEDEKEKAADWKVDVIAEQLKFRACLKILMTELRTLATGYEVDGGKLRFQLYNWLEKEIEAVHHICNYKVEVQGSVEELEKWSGGVTGEVDECERASEVDVYERHLQDRRRLQAKQLHAERRKAWLRKNEALLRVFLTYCSLHGAKGGGVTSVRMELLFLLQESQQETTVKQLHSPLPLATTLPLLSASIAPTKTVIANPVMHLNNHIQDILYTIGEDQPRLNVMLCEGVVAVYLSLLLHGLGTHSTNEMFRLAAHPLNSRMWAAVFGGGAKIIVKPKRAVELTPVAPPPTPPAEEVDRQRRRFCLTCVCWFQGRPVKETQATPPPIPTERPAYKEKFIPPELSMWDYFVAKEVLQETLIRYIFTKKRKQSEVIKRGRSSFRMCVRVCVWIFGSKTS
ncbi:DmX-like protein 2 [Bagarius yarrelli]|uniref:DmX-like protein 2 n=1 Tax=Bagarius yarrelli TaxID=175774 RepID=A0A556VXL0_BAGYA|nr:DmX-like protein 2 [Bagarius yarrelli]